VAAHTQFQLTSATGPHGLMVRARGRLTLGHGATERLWEPHVTGGGRVSLDLTGVTEVDARGLGVLASLARRARQNGITLSVAGASAVVSSLAVAVRLDRVLGGAWGNRIGRPAA
jgi:anti-anti-sigma regulatory factor